MKQQQYIRFSHAFERIFSAAQLDALGKQTGFMQRRHVTSQKFCMALVSALGAGTTNSIADIHRQFNHMHSTDIKLKPFHKQLVKMAAPEFVREVFEKALALHRPRAVSCGCCGRFLSCSLANRITIERMEVYE